MTIMKKFAAWALGCLIGLMITVLRKTCRYYYHDDPREELDARGIGHVYAALHAHQIAGSMACERGTVAMVSRSTDGEIVDPLLRFCGHLPVRGSSGGASKGGTTALNQMIRLVNEGRVATIAVDGPQGPRGRVSGGIALLGNKTRAAVLPAVIIPQRRWIMTSTWDRLQVPKPFSRIDAYFGKPLRTEPGETLEAFTLRIENELHRLEKRVDGGEAKHLVSRNPEKKETRHAA
ncbi:lysophospholipid acyltransferase family protein [Novipirellula artificiosorum]|uniref:DUF374 domain-containing protein n=1 Tax=Novipirellula artificiosorum TaxID=2528016 RepID=A0A5C6D607_9BACT|nr:DUF374 domain-containing protein [Novipirellula artificiosorum]TWU32268.1 hypothetical protein Poly41_57530 [Novipirellula artificiosorum]